MVTRGSSSSKTEAKLNNYVSGERFFSSSEKVIKFFFAAEKCDDTLFKAPGKTIACEHLNKVTA